MLRLLDCNCNNFLSCKGKSLTIKTKDRCFSGSKVTPRFTEIFLTSLIHADEGLLDVFNKFKIFEIQELQKNRAKIFPMKFAMAEGYELGCICYFGVTWVVLIIKITKVFPSSFLLFSNIVFNRWLTKETVLFLFKGTFRKVTFANNCKFAKVFIHIYFEKLYIMSFVYGISFFFLAYVTYHSIFATLLERWSYNSDKGSKCAVIDKSKQYSVGREQSPRWTKKWP